MISNHPKKNLSYLVLKEIKIKIRCQFSSLRSALIKKNDSATFGKDVGEGHFHMMLGIQCFLDITFLEKPTLKNAYF